MKKGLVLLLLLAFMTGTSLRGQTMILVLILGDKVATENFHFSMKIGVTHSIIHGYDEGKNGWGFNFGLVNNIKLSEHLSLVPEFIPIAPRSIRDVPVLTTGDPNLDALLIDPHSTDRRLKYIDVPVLLRWHLTRGFSLAAGPQFSFLTSAHDTYRSSPLNGAILTTELDIVKNLKRLDAGFVIDLQYVLISPVNGKGMNIFIRYGKGLVDLLKENNGNRYTTSLIQFGVTLPFIESAE